MNPRSGRMSSRPWYVYALAVIAVAFVILGVSDLGTATSSTTRTSKEVVTAQDGVVQKTVSGTGSVEPTVDDAVNFATSGTLASIDVTVGEHVKKRQRLATLDSSSAELTLEQAQATLTAARDNLTDVEAGDSTSDDTSDSSNGAATENEADATATTATTAKTTKPSASEIEQAEVEVDSDEATVSADQKAVAETTLYAPVSGTIASTAGDSVGADISGSSSSAGASSTADDSDSDSSDASSSGFVTIINSNTLTMTVSLSEDDISNIKVGQAATVSITALSGVELAAKVTSISPLGTDDDGVVSYDVTVTTTQSNRKVLPGMSATAEIITDQEQGVTVPTDAISGDSVEVYENGKSTAQAVTVGIEGTSRAVITSGLKAGQEVQVTVALPSLGTSTTSTTAATSETGGTFGGAGFAGGGARRFGGGAP